MSNTAKKVEKIVSNKTVKDAIKLQRQQGYYERLRKAGMVKKQTYNLKPTSAI